MRPQGSAIFRPVENHIKTAYADSCTGGIFFDRPFINTASRGPQPPVHSQHDTFRPKSSLIRVAPRPLGKQKPFSIYHKAIERSIQR